MLRVHHLTKKFKNFTAVHSVSFSLTRGKVLGLVGGSGCGKSTLARLLMHLLPPTSGQIFLEEREITHTPIRALSRDIQMIFQDPFSSLNPRMTVGDLISEPLKIHGLPDETDTLLDAVALPRHMKMRYPHEFSGGQRQRIGIARALALKPKILICDEPISSLDVSTGAQILQLLLTLKKELHLTYLFIAHDLAVVYQVSDQIAVMSQGQIVESAPPDSLFSHPEHPETQRLLAAIPKFKHSVSKL